jgi:predicted component of type VI protein secretion system
MKQPVVLKVYRGDKLEAVRQFESSQIVIGRSNDAQVQLADDGVALLHAMIEERDGEYYVSDLGSQTGTFKNGGRVLEDKLTSGDQLAVGSFHIRFYVGVPKPTAPPKFTDDTAVTLGPPSAISFTPVTQIIEPKEQEPAPPKAETAPQDKVP